MKLWERAVELDSQSATALAGLAEALLDSIGSAEDPSAPEKLRRADDLVRRAELLRPNSMLVVFVRVFLLGKQRRCAEVFPAAQRAISIFPNITSTPFWLGLCLMFDGRAAEAIPQFEQSVRLNPRNPYVYNRYLGVGYAYLFLDCHDEAIKWFRKSLAEHPSDTPRNRAIALAAIASAEALAGRITQFAEHCRRGTPPVALADCSGLLPDRLPHEPDQRRASLAYAGRPAACRCS